MKERTKRFALRVIRLVSALPAGQVADVIGRQLLRAGTSVGANYRAACRARSRHEFAARMGIVLEEADECAYWIELLQDAGILPGQRVRLLLQESQELAAISVSSVNTARRAAGKGRESAI